MDSACRSNVPDGAVFVGETTPVVEDATFLPIGRACSYETVNGAASADRSRLERSARSDPRGASAHRGCRGR